MAAPPETTIQNLNGQFILNKTLSNDTDPILALQGISWVTRTAIAYATVTLDISEFVEPNADDPAHAPVTKVDILQTATGGIQSQEKRTADWRPRDHEDRIFGAVSGQTRLIRGSKAADGKVRPDIEVQTEPKEEKIAKFLRGETLVDGEAAEGFDVEVVQDKEGVSYGEGEGLWLQSWVRSESAKWTAEQIWGFETIDGLRYYTRRVAVASEDGNYLLARLVYDYQGPVPAPEA
ncbi:hypothetical protein BGW36DRAFT_341913 [Talaromyces proteolyticus]|uniref:Uncharacterized protein n=1 Tax=Talaromyces proteolyticus TaxID=1131652 RepID=A0AAD4Q0N3_9EURO|nr:uncharacterized protein BGW36DRAFT_341913 [Talaromyces proteolyticus]KAH8697757.1 hypothetical protein BGW36DRAFT_341913 [Talaromyces proteolyticus]